MNTSCKECCHFKQSDVKKEKGGGDRVLYYKARSNDACQYCVFQIYPSKFLLLIKENYNSVSNAIQTLAARKFLINYFLF